MLHAFEVLSAVATLTADTPDTWASSEDVAGALDVTPREVRDHLRRLARAGRLESVEDPADYKSRLYRVTPKGRAWRAAILARETRRDGHTGRVEPSIYAAG